MNSIVAVLFLGVVAIVSSSAVRSSGWGSDGSGWEAPAAPAVVDLELNAELAAAGEGGASANQQLAAEAVGDANVPGQIADENGIVALVGQGGEITQVAAAASDGSTQTVNLVDVHNEAVAADFANVAVLGSDLATVAISAGTDAYGTGALAAGATSLNSVSKNSK